MNTKGAKIGRRERSHLQRSQTACGMIIFLQFLLTQVSCANARRHLPPSFPRIKHLRRSRSTIIPSSSSSSPFYSASLLEQSQSAPAVGIEAFICVHTPSPPLRPAKKPPPPPVPRDWSCERTTDRVHVHFFIPFCNGQRRRRNTAQQMRTPSFPGFALCPFSPFPFPSLSLFPSQGHSEEGAMHSVQNCKTEEEEDAAAAGEGGGGGGEKGFSALPAGEVRSAALAFEDGRRGTEQQPSANFWGRGKGFPLRKELSKKRAAYKRGREGIGCLSYNLLLCFFPRAIFRVGERSVLDFAFFAAHE